MSRSGASWAVLPGSTETRQPLLTAALVVAISALGGFVVLIYHPLARELRRAIRVRLTLRRSHEAVTTLHEERARLHDDLLAMSGGLELPGQVADDGRIVAAD